jgi:hypothetical protein
MREKVEDIEVNLTGEESNHSDAADKSRWFKRIRKGIHTSTADKKETPEGLWTKCPTCNHICTSSELKEEDALAKYNQAPVTLHKKPKRKLITVNTY